MNSRLDVSSQESLVMQMKAKNAQRITEMEDEPYRPILYAVKKEQRDAEFQMLKEAIEFQPELYHMISKIATKTEIQKYVADDDGKFTGGESKYYEQPNINQCDNGGENGEFVATGWECEREIYFEILKGNGYRNRKAEGYDRYAEEKSAEVFGDYSWSGNDIFSIGVSTITALAALTDDKDDDEKERKRKTDAKYAASNLGFALGGTASLAAYLLTKKQDENINEINSETNEESENLYEDDEFKMDM